MGTPVQVRDLWAIWFVLKKTYLLKLKLTSAVRAEKLFCHNRNLWFFFHRWTVKSYKAKTGLVFPNISPWQDSDKSRTFRRSRFICLSFYGKICSCLTHSIFWLHVLHYSTRSEFSSNLDSFNFLNLAVNISFIVGVEERSHNRGLRCYKIYNLLSYWPKPAPASLTQCLGFDEYRAHSL